MASGGKVVSRITQPVDHGNIHFDPITDAVLNYGQRGYECQYCKTVNVQPECPNCGAPSKQLHRQ